ncbi:MAG TPA: hypothetical protein VMT71_05750 [Syntrophorhabdales bacterium]|nr:hypothetical protein [Syntrophorhabdales bacterium]
MKRLITCWLLLVLLITPVLSARGQDDMGAPPDNAPAPAAGAIIGDFILVRPFALIATAIGTVLMVAFLPVSVPSGSTGVVAQKLVAEPFKFTFTRPLGYFPDDGTIFP